MPYFNLKKQIKDALENDELCIYPNKHTWDKVDYINFFDLINFNYIKYEGGLYYLNKEVINVEELQILIKYTKENKFIFPSINEKIE
jgi:hypothetical protein